MVRGAGERMSSGELAHTASRAADHAEYLALERDLEDSRRVCRFADEEDLVGTGRDTDRVRSSDYALEIFTGRCHAIDCARHWVGRHVNREHSLEIALGIKNLNAAIRAVPDVDV